MLSNQVCLAVNYNIQTSILISQQKIYVVGTQKMPVHKLFQDRLHILRYIPKSGAAYLNVDSQ